MLCAEYFIGIDEALRNADAKKTAEHKSNANDDSPIRFNMDSSGVPMYYFSGQTYMGEGILGSDAEIRTDIPTKIEFRDYGFVDQRDLYKDMLECSWNFGNTDRIYRFVYEMHPSEGESNWRSVNIRVANTDTAAEKAGTFSDVGTSSFCYDSVNWAVKQGVTTGKTDTAFAPDETCTNAQILTFLWRAAGKPTTATSNPFSDINDGNYYYNAALWAYEKGMVGGMEFNASLPCTRSQTVAYLWQAAGKPIVSTSSSFTDVGADADYAAAINWAVEKKITSGTSSTAFSPDATCNRGQIVTFLYRAYSK